MKNAGWHFDTPSKSGIYLVTYEVTAFSSLRAETATTKRHVTPLAWVSDRNGWNSLSGDGYPGFAYPVVAWRRLPRPARP